MNRLRIRDGQPRDRDAIEAVTLAAYQQYAALMPAFWDGYRQNILETLAAVHPAEQIVAEKDDEIVGTVLLYPGEPSTQTSPEVRLLAVEPAARGFGVGAALMQECIRRAHHSGASSVTLHTADIMQAGMRLYERLGFRRAAELDFEPVPGATIKGYRLRLDGAAV